MNRMTRWASAFMSAFFILLCNVPSLGAAPQTQLSPYIPGFTVTTFANIPYARGVIFDTAGNLLTLNPHTGTVYSIEPNGQVHIAADLPDVTAGYAGPGFDPISGNIYVSSYLNQSGNQILKITPGGDVSVFATGIPAPTNMTTDGIGNLYVASYACPASIYKVTSDGQVSTFATGLCRADGPIFDKNGKLFACDRNSNKVMLAPPEGGAVTTFASGFDIPTGLTFDKQGNLLVANSNNGTISIVDTQGISKLFGAGFITPVATAFDKIGQLFIADLGAGKIFKATPLDPTPPTATQLMINNGALTTTSTTVQLKVAATNKDGSQSGLTMSFSNDGEAWSTWTPFQPVTSWQLSSGDGTKTVYGRFKSSAGSISNIVSDTIVLDTEIQPEYAITINNGALYTNQISVQLKISAKPRTGEMQVSNDGGFDGVVWEPYAAHKDWQITRYRNQEITRLVYVRFRDVNGTVSPTYQDDIILDVNPPHGDAHATSTAQGTSLSLSATDDVSGVEDMRLSAQSDFSSSTWEPFTATHLWDFASKPIVYVQFRDYAGNVSPSYIASLAGNHTVFIPISIR